MRQPFVFVIMRFSDEFRDMYELGIKPAAESAGALCERVDEQMFTQNILDRIYKQIQRADFIVAEMTGRNANVFYEAGFAHGVGKPIIFVTKSADDIPFDLRHYPHVVYGDRIAVLKKELEKKIRWCVEHPGECLGVAEQDQKLTPDLERMALQIENYMKANKFTRVSYERIQKLHPSYTLARAEKLVELAPERFRPSMIKGGKPGLARVLP